MAESKSGARGNETVQKVGLGEIVVLTVSGSARTLLGSCIGLVLHDNRSRVGGLAHIVLPNSNGNGSPVGKYADTAVPELIRLIEASGGLKRHLTARLAGGANMFATTGPMSIGDQNLAIVEQLLKDVSIPVRGKHCGGTHGRKLVYDVETGTVTVEVVGGTPVEI